jgi:hypothetical protein
VNVHRMHATPRRKLEKSTYDVRTNPEPHSERIYLRATPTEVEALELLVQRWGATRSQIIRSLVIGATLGELDQLDLLDSIEASFDPLVDLDDVFASP